MIITWSTRWLSTSTTSNRQPSQVTWSVRLGMRRSITIRNLDDDVKRRLRVRAAEHGRSMEEEAREILLAVGARLRSDPAFAAQLQHFLDGLGDSNLADRVAALEAWRAAVEGGNP